LPQKNGFFRFWEKTNFPIEFLIFFPYWRWGSLPHLPKTEVLAVVSKMAIFSQIVIFDIGEIFGHFGTVTSSFSMGTGFLANFSM